MQLTRNGGGGISSVQIGGYNYIDKNPLLFNTANTNNLIYVRQQRCFIPSRNYQGGIPGWSYYLKGLMKITRRVHCGELLLFLRDFISVHNLYLKCF